MFDTPIRAAVATLFGCPLPARPRAFVAAQAAITTLEHEFVDPKTGATADLTALADAGATVAVRAGEWFSAGPPDDVSNWAFDGTIVDAAAGLAQAALPAALVATAGIYLLQWGLLNSDGGLLGVARTLLLVERSLFAATAQAGGPPTLDSVRMELRDTDRSENHNLDELEFDDAQLAYAMIQPVDAWRSETPQMRRYRFTTQSFPFTGQWIAATAGYAFASVAQGYRRDSGLVTGAGGVTSHDREKEQPYAAEAQRRIAEYRAWMLNKKAELGARAMFSSHASGYLRGGNW